VTKGLQHQLVDAKAVQQKLTHQAIMAIGEKSAQNAIRENESTPFQRTKVHRMEGTPIVKSALTPHPVRNED
jgi:hypothetical protein